MDILEKIVAVKKEEISIRKRICPPGELKKSSHFIRSCPSLYDALSKPGPSVIAEYKRKSPSKGIINISASVEEVAGGYINAGVAAISVLTDEKFFGGCNGDLTSIELICKLPLLRKEFIIDEYQVYESKSIGASAILLIGSILSKNQVAYLSDLAFSLGMEVLFEIHAIEELDKMYHKIRIIGVNNRNLKTFRIEPENSTGLIAKLPGHCLKVAESGFESPADIRKMSSLGYDAFLIGERFMRSEDPGKSASDFIAELK